MSEREVKGWAVVDEDGTLLEFGEHREPLLDFWMPSESFRIVPARILLEESDE